MDNTKEFYNTSEYNYWLDYSKMYHETLKPDFALYTAMSMDESFWKNVLLMQGHYEKNCPKALAFAALENELKHTGFFVQKGEIEFADFKLDDQTERQLKNRIFTYPVTQGVTPCFHAKIALLRYKDSNETFFRFAVLSKNLTHDGDLQFGTFFTIKANAGTADPNCVRIAEFLSHIKLKCTPMESILTNNMGHIGLPADYEKQLEEIINQLKWGYSLIGPKGTEVHFGGTGNDIPLYQYVFPNQYKKVSCICKGAFVGPEYHMMAKDPEKNFAYYNRYMKINNDKEIDDTHVKAYLTEKADGSLWFWSGSANCSNTGLGGSPYWQSEEESVRDINGQNVKGCSNSLDSQNMQNEQDVPDEDKGTNIECLVGFPLTEELKVQVDELFKMHPSKNIGFGMQKSTEGQLMRSLLREFCLFALKDGLYGSVEKEGNLKYFRIYDKNNKFLEFDRGSRGKTNYIFVNKFYELMGRKLPPKYRKYEDYRFIWLPVDKNGKCINELWIKNKGFELYKTQEPKPYLKLFLFDKRNADHTKIDKVDEISPYILMPVDMGIKSAQPDYRYHSKNLLKYFLNTPWIDGWDKTRKQTMKAIYEQLRTLEWDSNDNLAMDRIYATCSRLDGLSNDTESKENINTNNMATEQVKIAEKLGLKPFQQASVRHILKGFGFIYDNKNSKWIKPDSYLRHKFLLADEAGLGKTWVALGCIVEMQEALKMPINIYYACSNNRIREKNVNDVFYNRLNANGIVCAKSNADRLTTIDDNVELPDKYRQHKPQVTIYSFSTAMLDAKGSSGNLETELKPLAIELNKALKDPASSLYPIAHKILQKINSIKPSSENELQTLDARFLKAKILGNELFNEMREAFAKEKLIKYPPHLLILDEFHRYSGQLKDIDKLFSDQVPVLLLSATPYNMNPQNFNVDLETEESSEIESAFNNFEDMVYYLYDAYADNNANKEKADKIINKQKEFSKSLKILCDQPVINNWDKAYNDSKELSAMLGKFMCRSERSILGNGKLEQIDQLDENCMTRKQLKKAWEGHGDLRYEGPSPYHVPGCLSFIYRYNTGDDYKTDYRYQLKYDPEDLGQILGKDIDLQTVRDYIEKNIGFSQIYYNNVCGAENLLWVPASKPWYRGRENGVFAKPYTKLLIFSGYQMIPNAVSATFSWLVEKLNQEIADIEESDTAVLDLNSYIITDAVEAVNEALKFDPTEYRWAGADCDIIAEQLAKEYHLTDKERAYKLIGSPQLCAIRVLKRLTELDYDEIYATAIKVHEGFNSYINGRGTKDALRAWMVLNKGSIMSYFADGNLDAVLEEYIATCVPKTPKEALEQLADLLKVYRNNNETVESKIYYLYNPIKVSTEKQYCHFAHRFTHDPHFIGGNEVSGEKFQKWLNSRFNSPFWPMILSTTSIAQEGLDFHSYCMRIQHYTVPHTPMALEQREGRIDRFRSLLTRRRVAFGKRSDSWEELLKPNGNGFSPEWGVEEGSTGLRMERMIPYWPLSKEQKALERVLKAWGHYRSVIGIPTEEGFLEKLAYAASILGKDVAEIFPDLCPN